MDGVRDITLLSKKFECRRPHPFMCKRLLYSDDVIAKGERFHGNLQLNGMFVFAPNAAPCLQNAGCLQTA